VRVVHVELDLTEGGADVLVPALLRDQSVTDQEMALLRHVACAVERALQQYRGEQRVLAARRAAPITPVKEMRR
jgi:hypothetical protein